MSENWTGSNAVRALIWLGIVVPLGVVLFDLAAGSWTATTWVLLFLGVVNAAAWTAGRQDDRRTSRQDDRRTSPPARPHG